MEIYKYHGLIIGPDGFAVVMNPVGQTLHHFWKSYRFDCSTIPVRRLWDSTPILMRPERARQWIDDGCPLADVQESLSTLHVRWA